jgi:hypothetical protein
MNKVFGQKFEDAMNTTRSVIHPVKCTLEDIYIGKSILIKLHRKVIDS